MDTWEGDAIELIALLMGCKAYAYDRGYTIREVLVSWSWFDWMVNAILFSRTDGYVFIRTITYGKYGK